MRLLITLLTLGGAMFAQSHPALEFKTQAGPLKLTAIRHASLMVEAGGQVIQVDPVGADLYKNLPQADLILITDTHGDHLDANALAQTRKSSTAVIAPDAAAKQIAGARVLANGAQTTAGPWQIEAIPMYNLERGPSAGKVFHEKGRGNGYVVTYGGFRLYIAGDTENIPEMRALKNIDVALICMNLPYTMPPAEAAEAVKAFHPKVAIPYHYRGSDLTVFQKALEGSGVEVRILDWYH